jgi:hypothetical protein
LIMQVHDELVIELPEREVDAVRRYHKNYGVRGRARAAARRQRRRGQLGPGALSADIFTRGNFARGSRD